MCSIISDLCFQVDTLASKIVLLTKACSVSSIGKFDIHVHCLLDYFRSERQNQQKVKQNWYSNLQVKSLWIFSTMICNLKLNFHDCPSWDVSKGQIILVAIFKDTLDDLIDYKLNSLTMYTNTFGLSLPPKVTYVRFEYGW